MSYSFIRQWERRKKKREKGAKGKEKVNIKIRYYPCTGCGGS
jgi:hypothetical protein